MWELSWDSPLPRQKAHTTAGERTWLKPFPFHLYTFSHLEAT